LRKERDLSPRPTNVKDDRERKDEKVEREKVEKGCGTIAASVKNEKRNKRREMREKKMDVPMM